ncbi:hypothetical protein VHEMI01136 [[Torrubiella] hemipterigena]|uniref:Uncharacterized protein n=1 Tax=[Torrubiella] hemipterigena TaxID=1531966 RepID=A0A0A1SSA1_9HYPO|nr:hypothetical protein VHEMI01136 [[Torrubiella] hemipterigena]
MDHEHKDSQFPFSCDINNPTRHDDWDAMKYHHIYRDLWERKLPQEKFIGCTRNSFDYLELQAWAESIINHPGPSYDVIPTSFEENPYGVKVKKSRDAADQNSDHEEEYIPLP